MGFDIKCNFAPTTILLVVGVSLLPLDVGCPCLEGSNILLMVVQQLVVILEFSQEKMNTCPSTPPS